MIPQSKDQANNKEKNSLESLNFLQRILKKIKLDLMNITE